jgi:putative transposase
VSGVEYRKLKEDYEESKRYLKKADGINQVYLADFSLKMRIPGFDTYHVMVVMDQFSRYLLTLKAYSSFSADDFINGLETALEEAMKLSTIDLNQIIFLLTNKNRATTAWKSARYIEMSPFYHVTDRGRFPSLLGMAARLNVTINQDELTFNQYLEPEDAAKKLEKFRQQYNLERPHEALGMKTPYFAYTGKKYRVCDTV